MKNHMKYPPHQRNRQVINRRIRAMAVYIAISVLIMEFVAPIPATHAAENEQQNVTYTRKGTINGCGTMQGGASDGQYLYFICVTNNDSRLRIVKVTPDGKIVNQSKNFTRGQLGHGNDITYNSKLKLLVVSTWDEGRGGNTAKLIDPTTYEIKKSVSTNDNVGLTNICYNATTDQYVVSGKIYDGDLKYTGKRLYTPSGVDDDANTTQGKVLNQGIECNSSYIYVMRVVWGQNGYNVIAVYDWSGTNVAVYKVDNLNDEGENMAILDGVFYMGINEGGMSSGGNSNNDYFVQLDGIIGVDSTANSCSSALDPNITLQYQEWGIGKYGNECVCTEGGGSMSGDTNFAKIATYFSGKGLKDIAIAGILANLKNESNLTPFAVQGQPKNTPDDREPPSGSGYGIAQFTPATKIAKELNKNTQTSEYYKQYYSTKYGGYAIKPWNEGGTGIPEGVSVEVNDAWLKTQLDFFYKGEMQSTKVGTYRKIGGDMDATRKYDTEYSTSYISGSNTILQALNAAKNEKDAARIFVWIYERPADKPGAAAGREKLATEMLAPLQDIIGSGVPATAAGNNCGSSGETGDFAETVAAFAWEDGRRGSTQKSKYKEVMKTSKYGNDALHKYGNDCGAFVYNLMVTSGFEPDYPPTYTGNQKPWLDAHWEKIADPRKVNVADLRPGDVGIVAGDHVFVWIGDIEDFQGKSAEAANGSNTAPTAVLAGNTYSAPSKYTWYRKKATDAN